MKTLNLTKFVLFAILLCLSACTNNSEDAAIRSEIRIAEHIISNGLSFNNNEGRQSVSFSTNENWTLSIANTTSDVVWCTASATSGQRGDAIVEFTVTENSSYDNRSVFVTIKSGTVSKTFTISQKCANTLLLTTDKYELSQEGGVIEIEVKSNIDYEIEIAESAKDWVTETTTRALTTYKHIFEISLNEDFEKREGEIHFKSGDKTETVKVYQAGGVLILPSKNEYNVSADGETISVDIRSNVEFGVQMPNVDWITYEPTTHDMPSHTMKFTIAKNESYNNRFAEIIFYDMNSDVKKALKVIQSQKDAIVISEKEINVVTEGGTVEVNLSANIEFEVTMPAVDWIKQVNTRAMQDHTLYFNVAENLGIENRSVNITIVCQDSQLSETIVLTQQGNLTTVSLKEAGSMKNLLGDDYLNITALKIVGPINGDDVKLLHEMLCAYEYRREGKGGKLTSLDLSETSIVEGGGAYYNNGINSSEYYTSNNTIGDNFFYTCRNLTYIVLPNNITSIGNNAFSDSSLTSIIIPDNISSIGEYAFYGCESLRSVTIGKGVISIGYGAFSCCSIESVYITDLVAWCNITFDETLRLQSQSNPLEGAKLYIDNKEITDLIIPNEISTIKRYAFIGCRSIKSVKIHSNVTRIEGRAFDNCSSLISVVIGDGIRSIGSNAFSYSPINEVYCYSATPPQLSNYYYFKDYGYRDHETYHTFNGISSNATLYVPLGSKTAYENDSKNLKTWLKYFKNIKEID